MSIGGVCFVSSWVPMRALEDGEDGVGDSQGLFFFGGGGGGRVHGVCGLWFVAGGMRVGWELGGWRCWFLGDGEDKML